VLKMIVSWNRSASVFSSPATVFSSSTNRLGGNWGKLRVQGIGNSGKDG
jgi:hypothetical protein